MRTRPIRPSRRRTTSTSGTPGPTPPDPPEPPTPPDPAQPLKQARSRRLTPALALALLVPALCTVGLLLYLNERTGHSVSLQVGDHTATDRIDVLAPCRRWTRPPGT